MTPSISVDSRVWLKFEGLRVAHAFVGGESLCGNWLEPAGIRRPRNPFGIYFRHCVRCQRLAGLASKSSGVTA
jgi:hypothetical protein